MSGVVSYDKKMLYAKRRFSVSKCGGSRKKIVLYFKGLQKTGKTKGLYAFLGAFAVFCFCSVLILPLLSSEKEPDFQTALSKVTEIYYRKEFQEAEEEERRGICEKLETKLQKLLRLYKKEEEQRRLLLLLAVNEEYQKDMERAEEYYRQLLLYEPEYREGYTEYGMFLWKKGETEKSRKLLKEFEEKEEKGKLDGVSTENEKVWKERVYGEKE